MHEIRALLDFLADEDIDAIDRLCEMRGLNRRGRDAKCEALARSFRGDHEEFLTSLRKPDLVTLLVDPTEIDGVEYYLPSASRYSWEDLVAFALESLRDDEVPEEFEPVDDDDDDGDDEADDDLDDAEEPEGSDAIGHDETDYWGDEYAEAFARDVAYSDSDAAQPLRAYQERAVTTVIAALHPEVPKILHLATGGGKTRVANSLVERWIASRGGPVLWLTKDWRLLMQAARDAGRRHRGIRLARVGGDGKPLHPLPDGEWRDVVYSTVQTITRRLSSGVLARKKPSLVVWDECHWGEHGKAGKVLTACKRAGIPVLGLTATPRSHSRYEVAFSKTFRELVDEGFLARPVVEGAVRTGVNWRPQFRGQFEDVTRASLEELATNRARNLRIVRHYASHAQRFGKTIVFACSIDHVDRLAATFSAEGFAARAVHSGQLDGWNHRALEEFKTGAVQILVNMEMLTHGIDVPDARTVFLCRPTTSDILFAQMVGRASRRDDAGGKTSFFVVEFTDNVQEHGDLFTTAQRYFTGSGVDDAPPPSSVLGSLRAVRAQAHGFDPHGSPTWIPEISDLPESVRGLWYRHGQTFGIEFELTTLDGSIPHLDDAWLERAEEIRGRLAAALPKRVASSAIRGYAGSDGDKDPSVWNVEYDSSAGWEVTSRILSGLDGFMEVDVACRALDEAAAELGLRVSHRTGTHVHIGWLGRDVSEVKRALRLARLFEPAVATLVAPSRLAAFESGAYDTSKPNPYCRPVSSVFSLAALDGLRSLNDVRRIADADGARYVTVNVKPLANLHTVEVRLHHGTLEARKILLWVSLWQQILWAAAHRSTIPEVADVEVLRPSGDIVRLAQEFLPDARQPQQRVLLQRLAARRAEILEDQWRRVPSLQPWVHGAQNWVALP